MADKYNLGTIDTIEYKCLWDYKEDNGGTVLGTAGNAIAINDSIENYKSILIIGGIIGSSGSPIVDAKQFPVEILKNNYSSFIMIISSYVSSTAYFGLQCQFTGDKTFTLISNYVGSGWKGYSPGIQQIYGIK